MASATNKIEQELRALGRRRKKMQSDEAELVRDMETTLKRAYGKVPVAEAARLVGVHRTTVYRVYAPHNGSAGTRTR